MRPFFHIIAASLAAISIGACSDDARRVLAPPSPSNMQVPPGGNRGPRPDPFANNFAEINAGWNHTCARRNNGVMYCWGSNSFGQIGMPSTAKCGVYGFGLTPCVPQPTQVLTSTFTGGSSISAGGAHTCALSRQAVWCWGWDYYGQVGDGQSGVVDLKVVTPTQVSGGVTYAAVGAGGSASCGITTSHQLNCWGNGANGITPAMQSSILMWSNAVSVGTTHSCVLSINGFWGCWGLNDAGQLGLDPAVWPNFQGPINNPATNTATRVREGDSFTCADQPNGTVMCLGKNDVGQLGTSTFTGSFSFAVQTVGNGMLLHNVTTGSNHACALDVSGAAFCWGSNSEGKLGIGWTGGILTDPVQVGGGLLFVDIAAGRNHTCGIGVDNHLYCWGANDQGQLGAPGAPLHGQVTPVQAIDP